MRRSSQPAVIEAASQGLWKFNAENGNEKVAQPTRALLSRPRPFEIIGAPASQVAASITPAQASQSSSQENSPSHVVGGDSAFATPPVARQSLCSERGTGRACHE